MLTDIAPVGLSGDCHSLRVAAECSDVSSNPFERRDLVEQSIVAG